MKYNSRKLVTIWILILWGVYEYTVETQVPLKQSLLEFIKWAAIAYLGFNVWEKKGNDNSGPKT